MKSRGLLAGVVALLAAGLNSCSSSSTGIGTNSGTGFVWVATQGDQMVNSFNINENNGAVSHVGSAVATGVGPSAISIAQDGKTLFIANGGDNTVSLYTFNSDGSLMVPCPSSTKCSIVTAPPSQPPLASPSAMATDGANSLLFVANQGNDFISVFAITPGALTFKASFPVQTPSIQGGSGPASLAVSPASFSCLDTSTSPATSRSCFSLYAANQFSNTVTAYDYFLDSSGSFFLGSVDAGGNFVNGGTVAGSPYQVGTNPSGMAFSRCAGTISSTATTRCPVADADNLFVANSGSNNITVLAACIQTTASCPVPNGSLTTVGAPIPAGTGPTTVMVDLAADFVYVVDRGSSQVSEYSYSPATGILTNLGAAASTGPSPSSGGITANPVSTSIKDWVVISNNGASSLSVFSVDQLTQTDNSIKVTGGLTPLGSGLITVSGQPSAILVR
ncbi:MAG TPA: beta-propeller fold lactonase family protein [Terriglobales bacterium]